MPIFWGKATQGISREDDFSPKKVTSRGFGLLRERSAERFTTRTPSFDDCKWVYFHT
ncbi:hypothetical protein [Candidatus Brocadia sinica]|uniref:hypothetical protein n=1 Tax=Candidatus Brocadia sinica TaxID=795830 RepID=UPI0012FF237A|nr:hypothetical protein [Candidatus Brocadia sinica]NOG42888.1 hypothetical protein [Planctomycetota bacterium]